MLPWALSVDGGDHCSIKVTIPSVPTAFSHLHLERRRKLQGLGWWPPEVYSGLCVPVLLAAVRSNKDKDYYR